jgi:holliday junction DNA helicase RuvA
MMMHAIDGTLLEVVPHSPLGSFILLKSQGISWQLGMTRPCMQRLPAVGQPCEVFTALIIREAGTQLFGFASRDRRDVFNLLLGASGVGPKMALSLLEVMSVQEIVQAVITEQHRPLTTAKGVGPKLAQKMVLELKDTMLKWRQPLAADANPDSAKIPTTPAFQDAETVLLSLGYTPQEIAHSFTPLDATETQAERVLQQALQQLSRMA